MANGKIRFGKQSGGQLALVIPDGVANTEVIVPESGVLATEQYIDNTTVKLTGNQTIAGVKTFSSSPIVPTPTTNTQVANKAYVDTQITGLGTAATKNVGTAYGDVMTVGAFGLGGSSTFTESILLRDQHITGFGVQSKGNNPLPLDNPDGQIGKILYIGDPFWGSQMWFSYTYGKVYFRNKESNGEYESWKEFYHTGNTTKTPDGTLKASSPVINLYTDKHDLHNEPEFGATPVVTRKSKGVYEITGTLGLRTEGWYLDTPSDRNGNKYFNIEWTQNITPDAVDGVVDEYRDDIVVTIETFERVWNKDTGMFDNGNPIDINDLQNRFVQLRFNEIKVEQEINNGNNKEEV